MQSFVRLYNNDKIYATEIYLTVLEMKFTTRPQYTLAYANFKYYLFAIWHQACVPTLNTAYQAR